VLAALSAAGLPTDRFAFEGFLPNRQGKRRAKLLSVAGEERVMLFYESPKRLLAALADLLDVMGNREVVIARELTKIYEEFLRGPAADVLERLQERQVKGEVVLLVAPAQSPAVPMAAPVANLLREYIAAGEFSLKDAVRRVALETGRPRGEVYAEALKLKGSK
jgi:16S rRNA (cytidine1402-2'-O)-methyltransferase